MKTASRFFRILRNPLNSCHRLLFEYIAENLVAYLDGQMKPGTVRQLDAIIAPTAKIYRTSRIQNLLGKREAIQIGANTHVRGSLLTFWNAGQITIGELCYIGHNTSVWSQTSVSIGNRVLVSHGVNIFDTDAHPIGVEDRRKDAECLLLHGKYLTPTQTKSSSIVLEDDSWICANATILKGVCIGTGSIVAAGSVVTKSVPSRSLVAGSPAKIVANL